MPYNIFGTVPGGVSQAAVNYLSTPGFSSGQTSEYVVNASVTAALGEYGLQSPLAIDGIGINVGAEYRKEALSISEDEEFLTGDLAGQGTPFGVPNSNGSFDVKEEFAEISVPLIDAKPFFYRLMIDGSYRHSEYSSVGGTDTYKGEISWSPIKDITFRGAYNRAVRAPNVLELFAAPTVGLFSGSDPCAGPVSGGLTGAGFTQAQCARSGVTAAEFGTIDPSPASQYNQRTSGTATLKPEVADTFTAGIVLQPHFFPNFVVSVDAYRIKIRNEIGTVGANLTLTQCVTTGNPFFCNAINRAAGGSLFTGNSYVDNPTLNLGSVKTQGIDVNASYNREIGRFGRIGFDVVGTYLDQYEVTPISGANSVGSYQCAGYFGATCGTPLPRWRSKSRVTLTTPMGLEISGAWRYFSPVKSDFDSSDALLGNGPGTAATIGYFAYATGATSRIPAVSYFDLSLTQHIEQFTARLGVQNIADKSPPITPGFSNNGSNTYAQVYDSRGRYIYAAIQVNF